MRDYPIAVWNSAGMLEIFLEECPHVVKRLGRDGDSRIDVMVDKEDTSRVVGVIIWKIEELIQRYKDDFEAYMRGR